MIIKEIYFFLHCHPMINILWIVEWKFREKEMIFFYILDVVQGCNKQCNICYCPDLWQSDNWSHCADDWNLCPSLCVEWVFVHYCRYLHKIHFILTAINWLNRYLDIQLCIYSLLQAEGLTAIECWVIACIIFVFGALLEYTVILLKLKLKKVTIKHH